MNTHFQSVLGLEVADVGGMGAVCRCHWGGDGPSMDGSVEAVCQVHRAVLSVCLE